MKSSFLASEYKALSDILCHIIHFTVNFEEEDKLQKVQEASQEEVLQAACKFCCEVDVSHK